MILFDDHVHSGLSIDGEEMALAFCRAAVERGLGGLSFTEHLDTDPADPGYGRYNFELLRRASEEARRMYGCRLSILVGAEVDFQPLFAPQIADFIRACPLDFVLGSVHYVQREFVCPEYFLRHGEEEAYRNYLGAVEAAVASGLFDSLAHLDLAKRYGTPVCGPFTPGLYWERIDRILRLLIQRGMALEINASGWRQAPGEPYPGEAIVQRYAELGGRLITIGSDAHRPADIGRDLDRAIDLARRAGFTHLTRFVARQPQPIPIGC